ncbi:HD-GYP domain-containing protein [Desulfogranum japonicum]|uniref:HD-GYP domain-containing protein n=1 Tax=Desulfogranum japonicum TaxID=231447 RepID=UPI00042A143B|nr:HD domain-containing protein [Desulfogranum japonicum]
MSISSGKTILKAVHKFNRTSGMNLSDLDQRTGCLILKAINGQSAIAEVTQYLQKYAKNIHPESVPGLLEELPVVLARKVPEATARKVRNDLRQLQADVAFIPISEQPATDEAGDMPPESNETDIAQAVKKASTNKGESKKDAFTLAGFPFHQYAGLAKELAIIAAMLLAAGLLNFTVASQYLLLGLFTVPTILSAFFFGRNQAVMTAFASILLVTITCLNIPERFITENGAGLGGTNQWYHVVSWGCILLLTAYLMGSLYELHQQKIKELRRTYQGILLLLRHVITQDDNTEDHCFRVSIYAAKIARECGLNDEEIADIRSAALLHDIGSPDISREVLEKASFLASENNQKNSSTKTDQETLLSRILPLLISNHTIEAHPKSEQADAAPLPIGAHILAVADRYDTLVNTKPFTDTTSQEKAREIIVSGSGKEFDATVVKAFDQACLKGEMTIPSMLL